MKRKNYFLSNPINRINLIICIFTNFLLYGVEIFIFYSIIASIVLINGFNILIISTFLFLVAVFSFTDYELFKDTLAYFVLLKKDKIIFRQNPYSRSSRQKVKYKNVQIKYDDIVKVDISAPKNGDKIFKKKRLFSNYLFLVITNKCGTKHGFFIDGWERKKLERFLMDLNARMDFCHNPFYKINIEELLKEYDDIYSVMK